MGRTRDATQPTAWYPTGDPHQALYQIGPTAFHDITVGTNGAYTAGPGWDPCTGLGSPNGQALLTALTA